MDTTKVLASKTAPKSNATMSSTIFTSSIKRPAEFSVQSIRSYRGRHTITIDGGGTNPTSPEVWNRNHVKLHSAKSNNYSIGDKSGLRPGKKATQESRCPKTALKVPNKKQGHLTPKDPAGVECIPRTPPSSLRLSWEEWPSLSPCSRPMISSMSPTTIFSQQAAWKHGFDEPELPASDESVPKFGHNDSSSCSSLLEGDDVSDAVVHNEHKQSVVKSEDIEMCNVDGIHDRPAARETASKLLAPAVPKWFPFVEGKNIVSSVGSDMSYSTIGFPSVKVKDTCDIGHYTNCRSGIDFVQLDGVRLNATFSLFSNNDQLQMSNENVVERTDLEEKTYSEMENSISPIASQMAPNSSASDNAGDRLQKESSADIDMVHHDCNIGKSLIEFSKMPISKTAADCSHTFVENCQDGVYEESSELEQ